MDKDVSLGIVTKSAYNTIQTDFVNFLNRFWDNCSQFSIENVYI